MRAKISLRVVLFFILIFAVVSSSGATAKMLDDKSFARLNMISIPFLQNQGQTDGKVAYYAKTFGGTLYVTRDGQLVYDLPAATGGVVLRETFQGFESPEVRGKLPARTRVSWFGGHDPKCWLKQVPSFMGVSLGSVWRGIKIELRAHGNNVEKIFRLDPGACVEKIRIRIAGADSLMLSPDGRLRVTTELGDLYFTRPLAYQEIDGCQKNVQVSYWMDKQEYGFRLGEFDRTKPLIIDPLLGSTYLGGSAEDMIHAVALDSNGNIFVAGHTQSTDFPTTSGAYDTSKSNANNDTFVSKFDSDLSNLLASTFLASSTAYGLAMDATNQIYVTGQAASGFPTTSNAYSQTLNGWSDIFISRLSNDLSDLQASTFIGGSGSARDVGYDVTIGNGSVYVAGYTQNGNYPTTTGAYDESYNGNDSIVISRFDADLTTLQNSTFFGGSGENFAYVIKIDNSGSIFIAGRTSSSDFPVTPNPGAYQTTYGGGYRDGFISKFSADLSALQASTFLGGGDVDSVSGMVFDGSGNVLVTGGTVSSDFPFTNGAYVQRENATDHNGIFVSRLDNSLSSLSNSAFIGSGDGYADSGIAMDASGNIFITGHIGNGTLPAPAGAYDDSFNGVGDVFIAKLDNGMANLLAATYLGGGANDYPARPSSSIVVDSNGDVVVAGYTASSDFPVAGNAFDSSSNGSWDGFVSKLDNNLSGPRPVITVNPVNLDFGTVTVNSSTSLSFTITNNGTAPLDVTSVVSDNALFTVVSPTFPQNLPPGNSLTVSIGFNSANAGNFTGQLTITSNDPDNAVINVSLVAGIAAGGPAAVPTLAETGMMVMLMLLSLVALAGLRNREGRNG